MPKVSDIIFCLNASSFPGQGVCANTILTTLSPEYIPGLFTFSVVITLLDIDTEGDHKLKIVFSGPEEFNLTLEGPVPPISDPSNLPQQYQGLNVSINLNNVNFVKSGEYKLSIFCDDEIIGEKDIFVKGKNEE